MKERPILYRPEMVNATLNEWKTETRRIVKPPRGYELSQFAGVMDDGMSIFWAGYGVPGAPGCEDKIQHCPYGQPGDRLWVRETFCYDNKEYIQTYKDEPWRGMPDVRTAETYYRASESEPDIFLKWTPSIFMPRWASRILLEITEIRVERLQDIDNDAIFAEGINQYWNDYADGGGYWKVPAHWKNPDGKIIKQIETENVVEAFANLWNSINEKRGYGWDENPRVWVICFTWVKEGKT